VREDKCNAKSEFRKETQLNVLYSDAGHHTFVKLTESDEKASKIQEQK